MSSQPGRTGRPTGRGLPMASLVLEYPMSLGTYDRYEQAQRAVDFLSDNEFPVQNCMIVGTELKQVERVTGRLTRQRVAVGGALSGMWLGLFVGLIFSLFGSNSKSGGGIVTIVATVIFGAAFGIVWALIGYAATRGQRDFTSVSQVVATKYEVLVEHKLAEQARELLSRLV